MKPVFRTLSFWACCVGVVLDIGLAAGARAAGVPEWSPYFLGCGACFAVGAAGHWLLDRTLTPRR